ncbi:MAG: hypothetical protein R3A80_10905 [Bdellovibrionota bacterium]
MKTLIAKQIILSTLLLSSSTLFAAKATTEQKAAPQAVTLQINLGTTKLPLKVPNPELATKIQEAFKKKGSTDLEIPYGADSKESLEGYKGLSEQEQRQMLCTDINGIIDLKVANSEATEVSKIDSKMQIEILMLKHLQEQVALNWADKQLFKNDSSSVSTKEILEALLTEIPVLISPSTVRDFFCNEATLHKANDCKKNSQIKTGT